VLPGSKNNLSDLTALLTAISSESSLDSLGVKEIVFDCDHEEFSIVMNLAASRKAK
jgi:hypothetical protein